MRPWDNGRGHLRGYLRPLLPDPFITTKINGSGLGLAIVAKIVDDLGGAIEFDSQPGRTTFRVMLAGRQHGRRQTGRVLIDGKTSHNPDCR
ncbi:MAG: ATP-binding protein [Alphaproteobacteria bacterium]